LTFWYRTAYDAHEVYVTGTFDNWAHKANKLTKNESGALELEIHLPLNEKVSYKVNNSPSPDPQTCANMKHRLT